MDPVTADRSLPSLVQALGSPDAHVASQAEILLARHPLFCLRRGPWAAPDGPVPLRKVFFPKAQTDQTMGALIELTWTTSGSDRIHLVERLARLNGLENVVNLSRLNLDANERDYVETLTLNRSLQQSQTQVTVVLNYQCNKQCSYCFASEIGRRQPQPIPVSRFIQALEWARRAGASRVAVTGGEPTLHPDFHRLMAELRARNFTTCFSTNGCGSGSAFDCLSDDFVDALTFHILDDDEYAPGEAERLEQNIRRVQAKGIRLIFRYVLVGSTPPRWQRYLELLDRYRPWLATFSPVFPGPYRREMSTEVRHLFRAKDSVWHLVQAAVRLNIRPMIAKPVPLCMFSRDELVELTAVADLKNVCDVSRNQYTNNTLINPDLSLYPCMALPWTGARLQTTPSLEEFGRVSRAAVEPLLQTPMLEECPSCQLFQMRLCQPACLAFVLRPS